jgi:hypothetical protein
MGNPASRPRAMTVAGVPAAGRNQVLGLDLDIIARGTSPVRATGLTVILPPRPAVVYSAAPS